MGNNEEEIICKLNIIESSVDEIKSDMPLDQSQINKEIVEMIRIVSSQIEEVKQEIKLVHEEIITNKKFINKQIDINQ